MLFGFFEPLAGIYLFIMQIYFPVCLKFLHVAELRFRFSRLSFLSLFGHIFITLAHLQNMIWPLFIVYFWNKLCLETHLCVLVWLYPRYVRSANIGLFIFYFSGGFPFHWLYDFTSLKLPIYLKENLKKTFVKPNYSLNNNLIGFGCYFSKTVLVFIIPCQKMTSA